MTNKKQLESVSVPSLKLEAVLQKQLEILREIKASDEVIRIAEKANNEISTTLSTSRKLTF